MLSRGQLACFLSEIPEDELEENVARLDWLVGNNKHDIGA